MALFDVTDVRVMRANCPGPFMEPTVVFDTIEVELRPKMVLPIRTLIDDCWMAVGFHGSSPYSPDRGHGYR